MARQRPPVEAALPFEYVVLGQPRSAQNRTSGYAKWYGEVVAAVIEQVEIASKRRGFVGTKTELRALIVWLSAQPNATDHPDLANIQKPLLDALKERVIEDDRQIRRIESALIDLNKPGLNVPRAVIDQQDKPRYKEGEMVYLRIDAINVPDGPDWEWWK